MRLDNHVLAWLGEHASSDQLAALPTDDGLRSTSGAYSWLYCGYSVSKNFKVHQLLISQNGTLLSMVNLFVVACDDREWGGK